MLVRGRCLTRGRDICPICDDRRFNTVHGFYGVSCGVTGLCHSIENMVI